MNIEQQIAKDLRDSGLFDWCPKIGFGRVGYRECELVSWPDADTMEDILAEMGLQVVWSKTGEYWKLTNHMMDFVPCCYRADTNGIKKGQRTLANNAAGAWLSKQAEWSPKLEAAINKVRGKK